MVTSKLNKKLEDCIGGVFIYSGRPDPTWTIGIKAAKKLEKIWNSLDDWTGEHPSAPPLGYKGCFMKCKPDTEWFTYRGIVILKTSNGDVSRIDKDKIFESLLLSTAPKGLLPIEFI